MTSAFPSSSGAADTTPETTVSKTDSPAKTLLRLAQPVVPDIKKILLFPAIE